MPRLLLFRHAKAERTQPGATDHDRALTKSGRSDSADMGSAVAEYGPVDLVLCSDAKRALETWEGAAPSLTPEPEVRLLRTIYSASDTYLPIIETEGGKAGTILLVGHNPTMHDTAVAMVGRLDGADGRVLASRFPKAALAVIDFDGEWANLRPGQAKLAAFVLPERD